MCCKVHGKPEESGQQIATECLCCSVRPQLICICYKNCGEPDRRSHCPKCQVFITDRNCVPQTQTQAQAGTLESTTKPPDMSILKNRSQPESYISTLERWATIAKTSGMAETLLADITLTYGVERTLELCREMSKHFDNSSKGNSKETKKIVTG